MFNPTALILGIAAGMLMNIASSRCLVKGREKEAILQYEAVSVAMGIAMAVLVYIFTDSSMKLYELLLI